MKAILKLLAGLWLILLVPAWPVLYFVLWPRLFAIDTQNPFAEYIVLGAATLAVVALGLPAWLFFWKKEK